MKTRIKNYTFNAANKQITLTDYTTVSLESILLITNVTDNIIIYNFADPTLGGSVSDNIITLDYDTTSMSNSDKLQIYFDTSGTPSSEESLELMRNQLDLLRRIIKLLEPSSNTHVATGAQRVVVNANENALTATTTFATTGGGPHIAGVIGAGHICSADPYVLTSSATNQGKLNVWVGPVDQRFILADQSRNTYNNSIRNKLSFS